MTEHSTAHLRAEINPVYPGHAVTVAYFIVHAFDTCHEALGITKHQYSRAVGSMNVPGAGDGAQAGDSLLRKLAGGIPFDDAMEWARQEWARRCSQYEGTPNWEKHHLGQAQADEIEPQLRKLEAWWLNPVDALANLVK